MPSLWPCACRFVGGSKDFSEAKLRTETECAYHAAMRIRVEAVEQSELLWASMDVQKWLDSPEVKETFQRTGLLTVTHPHLGVHVSPQFSVWAQAVLARFRKAIDAAMRDRSNGR